jgi:hypothetical protein
MRGPSRYLATLVGLCLAAAIGGCGGKNGSTDQNGSTDRSSGPQGGDPVALVTGPDSTTGVVLDNTVPGTPFAIGVQVINGASDAADVESIELIDPTPGLAIDGTAPFEGTPNALGLGTVMLVTPEILSGIEARQDDAFIGSRATPGWTNGGWLVFVLRTPSDGCYEASGVRVRYRVGDVSYETDLPASLGVRTGATLSPDEVCTFQQ